MWRGGSEKWREHREEQRKEDEEEWRRNRRTHFLRSCTTEVAVEESSPVVGSSR